MFKNLSVKNLALSIPHREVIELALSFGFKGIDLDIVEFARNVELDGLAHARRLLDSAKMKIGCVELPVDLSGHDDVFARELLALPKFAELLVSLGGARFVKAIDAGSDIRPFHDNFEFHRQRISQVANALEPFPVKLGLGFQAANDARCNKAFQFVHNLDMLLMLLSMVGKRNVGVWVDVWNIFASGGSMDSLKKIPKDQWVALILSDIAPQVSPEAVTLADRLPIGQGGGINASAVLEFAAEQGFDGPVTPAVGSKCFAGKRRDEVVKTVGKQLEEAWKGAKLSPQGKRLVAV